MSNFKLEKIMVNGMPIAVAGRLSLIEEICRLQSSLEAAMSGGSLVKEIFRLETELVDSRKRIHHLEALLKEIDDKYHIKEAFKDSFSSEWQEFDDFDPGE